MFNQILLPLVATISPRGGARWPPTSTLEYNTLLQLMLFLLREGKWEEVSYYDMFFSLRNNPDWQRDCGIKALSDSLVLALEKENRNKMRELKRCCSACSIRQRCTRADKVYRVVLEEQEQDLDNLFSPYLGGQGERSGDLGRASAPFIPPPIPSIPPPTPPIPSPIPPAPPIPFPTPPIPSIPPPTPPIPSIPTIPPIPPNTPTPIPSSPLEKTPGPTPPSSPIASRTRGQILQAPLQETVIPGREKILVKVPFSTLNLEAWERVVGDYRNDPVNTAKHLRYIMKQHNPDLGDIQLLLDAFTETEKQLVLKTAGDCSKCHKPSQSTVEALTIRMLTQQQKCFPTPDSQHIFVPL
ncbi:uncharacterized protein GJ701_012949 isoform 1-T2 [Geothlypis trichas]